MNKKLIIKTIVITFGVVLVIPILIVNIFLNEQAFSGFKISKISIGRMTKKEIEQSLAEKLEKFKKQAVSFSHKEKTISISPKDVGAEWDINKTLKKVSFYRPGFTNLFDISGITAEGKNIILDASFHEEKLNELLKNLELKEQEMKNARIVWNGKILFIEEEQRGEKIDEENLKKNITAWISGLNESPIAVKFRKIEPEMTKVDLEKNFEEIKAKILRAPQIKAKQFSEAIDIRNSLEKINFKKKKKLNSGERLEIKEEIELEWNSEYLKEFITKNFIEKIEREPTALKIYETEDKKIIFEGEGKDGQKIEYDEAEKLMNLMVNKKDIHTIEIPVRFIPHDLTIDPQLQKTGIQELIGTGYTTYYGSPANRMHNIKNGISKFQGKIIQAGETFSFNKILGAVDASTGYKKELVIKPEGTIPEYGGGLCQVSTTMYRAALKAGFPVVQRKSHSYAVSYYSQVEGHGIDATIYPGSSDLQFLNDTPGNILIQGYAEGAEAYFKIYGTDDGRRVEMEGPYISNNRSPGETEYIKTKNLAIGTKKQVERAIKGFDTLWYRHIMYPTGEIKKEEIKSQYRAVPARILIGNEGTEIAEGTGAGEQYFRD